MEDDISKEELDDLLKHENIIIVRGRRIRKSKDNVISEQGDVNDTIDYEVKIQHRICCSSQIKARSDLDAILFGDGPIITKAAIDGNEQNTADNKKESQPSSRRKSEFSSTVRGRRKTIFGTGNDGSGSEDGWRPDKKEPQDKITFDTTTDAENQNKTRRKSKVKKKRRKSKKAEEVSPWDWNPLNIAVDPKEKQIEDSLTKIQQETQDDDEEEEKISRARRTRFASLPEKEPQRRRTRLKSIWDFVKRISQPFLAIKRQSFLGGSIKNKQDFERVVAERDADYAEDFEGDVAFSVYNIDYNKEYPKEKGDEWLEFTASDTSHDEDEILRNSQKTTKEDFDVSPECDELMKAMKIYFLMLTITGRMPFTLFSQNKCLKFKINRRDWKFGIFCVTTFFLGLFCVMMFHGLVDIYFATPPYLFYEKIENVEMDKYLIYAMLTFAYVTYSFLWSISIIFDSGFDLSTLLTRFNIAVVTLQYEASDGLSKLILMDLIIFGLYFVITSALFLFGENVFPVVKGASGLIGIVTFRQFSYNIRLEEKFYFYRAFGFLIHLYTLWASRVITLMILIYCKVIKNLSQRWNLRLAYALGKIGVLEENKVVIQYRIIPYEKLFAEHIIITTLLRNSSHVFTVPLLTYYLFKGLAMVVTLFALGSYFLLESPKFRSIYVEDVERNYPKAIPIAYKDPNGVTLLTLFVCVFQTWAGFFFTSEKISACGFAISSGYGFIRRHGLILCRSSNERRFIMSLQNQFAPVATNQYYLQPGKFLIDRPFIYNFTCIIFLFFTILTQLNPSRLQTLPITICSDNGTCMQITIPRGVRDRFGPAAVIESLQEGLKATQSPITKIEEDITTTIKIESPTTYTTTQSSLNVTEENGIIYPCISPDLDALRNKNNYTFGCPSNWIPGKTDWFELPIIFQKVSKREYKTIQPYSKPCSTQQDILEIPYKGIEGKIRDYPGIYKDCFGNDLVVSDFKRDDCGAHLMAIPSPDADQTPRYPSVYSVMVQGFFNNGSNERQEFFCCYKYPDPLKDTSKVKGSICNVPRVIESRSNAKCSIGHDRARSQEKDIATYVDLLTKKKIKINHELDKCFCADLLKFPLTDDENGKCQNLIEDMNDKV